MISIMGNLENQQKLRAMIIFILRKLPSKLNRIALCKNLYYSEMHYFQKTGKSISGVDYLHIEGSPMPRHFNEIMATMVESKEVRVVPQVAPEVIEGRQIMVLRGMVFECDAPLVNALSREELRAVRMVSSTLQNEMNLETRYFPQYYQHYVQAGLFEVIPFIAFPKRPHLKFKAWSRKIYRLMWQ
ncbi:MAG: hypothetical protein JSR44_14825 [Spirochaetes bacterium]|nr:hypothetical protein [Spirochaetota bacterium]